MTDENHVCDRCGAQEKKQDALPSHWAELAFLGGTTWLLCGRCRYTMVDVLTSTDQTDPQSDQGPATEG